MRSVIYITCIFSLTLSCQSSKYPKAGHFSITKLPARTIASESEEDLYVSKYLGFQDPKQILIYCNLNSQKPETCYEINLNDSLNSFIKFSQDNRDAPIALLKERLSFSNQYDELIGLTEEAQKYNMPLLLDISKKRKEFCLLNAKKNINKCLNQYIRRDTFSILNKFQNKFKLNGLEYLYLKKQIRSDLENEFISLESKIQNKQSQSI